MAESISSAEDDTRGLLAGTGGSEEMHAVGGRGGDDATISGAGGGVQDIEASGGSQRDRQGSDESDEDDTELAYTAAHVTSILKPVAVTMIMVILCMKITQDSIFAGGNIQSPYLVYREDSSDSAEQLMTKALVNSLVILVAVLTMTFVMYLLYKYNCIKFLITWLAISVASLLAFSGGTLFYALATSLRSKFPGFRPLITLNSRAPLRTSMSLKILQAPHKTSKTQDLSHNLTPDLLANDPNPLEFRCIPSHRHEFFPTVAIQLCRGGRRLRILEVAPDRQAGLPRHRQLYHGMVYLSLPLPSHQASKPAYIRI